MTATSDGGIEKNRDCMRIIVWAIEWEEGRVFFSSAELKEKDRTQFTERSILGDFFNLIFILK